MIQKPAKKIQHSDCGHLKKQRFFNGNKYPYPLRVHEVITLIN